jgi:fatty-acyl-CoA synthase
MNHSPFASPQHALSHWAERAGEREALAFPLAGKRLSFREWQRQSLALARWMIDRGVTPGTAVAVLAENRIEWPVVQIAAAMAHCTFIPLNTHYRSHDLAYALKQSKAEVIFLSSRFRNNEYLAMVSALRPELPHLRQVVTFDEGSDDAIAFADALADGERSATAITEQPLREIGSLQYTSGTTGFSKGALLTHYGMLENAWQTVRRLRFGPEDRYTSIIPLFHCAGCIMGILSCLQAGATYVGVPAFDPVTMFKVIEGERCTALSGVPTSYLAMLQHPDRSRYDLTSLRTGTCGGADCNPDVLAACARDFPLPQLVQVYGQTESSTLIAMPSCDDPIRVKDTGPPLDGYEVRITHPESGEPLAPGSVGQIEARGRMVMAGYHERPKETAETVTEDGWLRTGDLGSLSADGRLTLVGGRLKDMIIRGGENIYPVEIENVLGAHPAIVEASVFAVPDTYYGEAVAAAVRLRERVPADALAAYCRARIAGFKVPAQWFAVETFPLTSSGKIRKVELRAMAADRRLDVLP